LCESPPHPPCPPPLPEKNEEKKTEIEKEKEEMEMEISGTASTTSLNFLVDGVSSEPPYEVEVVDARDSLLNYVMDPEHNFEYEERMKEGMGMCIDLGRCCKHILAMGQDGERFLIGLSPHGVVRAPDDVLLVVFHKFLVEKDEEREGQVKFAMELGRWKAPEIIKRTEEKENMKSLVFTIGMMCHTLIMRFVPYDEDNDEVAMGRIMVGERPCVGEMEQKGCAVLPLIKRCWSDSPVDRPTLREMVRIAKQLGKPEKKKKEEVKKEDEECNTDTKEKDDDDGKDEDKDKDKDKDKEKDKEGKPEDGNDEKEKKVGWFCYVDKEDPGNEPDKDDDVVFDRKAFEKAFDQEIANVRARETEELKREAEEREREEERKGELEREKEKKEKQEEEEERKKEEKEEITVDN
jgi:hypothetical protein